MKGQIKNGKLVDGIEYTITLQITKKKAGKEIPVPQEEISGYGEAGTIIRVHGKEVARHHLHEGRAFCARPFSI